MILSKDTEENTIYLLNMGPLGTKMSRAYWNTYGQLNMFLKQAPKSLFVSYENMFCTDFVLFT